LSTIFTWEESEMEALVESCARDDSAPILKRLFPPGSKLLEAGCGAGRWVRYLKDRGYSITGLEYSAETVAMVNRRWPDLDVVQGDCERSPFPDGSFDGALSFGVVEHWREGPQPPLRDLLRVLKPGGKAYITAPCFNLVRRVKRALWWDEITKAPRVLSRRLRKGEKRPMTRTDRRFLFPVYPAFGEFFEYRMSARDFRAEVERAGFEVLEHVPTAILDGVYHELNPFGLLVKFENWAFRPTRLARAVNRYLARSPFAHSHMQAIVARKPAPSPEPPGSTRVPSS
jgi:SAM-dependent methyltransferase